MARMAGTVPTEQSRRLAEVARRVADAVPEDVAHEIVLTGSVSRGVADDVSDIEMLIVTAEQLPLDGCFRLASAAGLERLGTWGAQDTPARRVSGDVDDVPIELIWWPRAFAEEQVDALFEGEPSGTGDALAHGISLRTVGLLERWQARLRDYPDELAIARIDNAALTWGGFAAAGLLTLTRPTERVSMLEYMVGDAQRVLKIVYALNRVWPPTTKRLAERLEPLALKPEQLAERIERALVNGDLLVMTELQLDTALLAPDTPNIVRARTWLAEGARILRER
jgi:predicted nucleotidyltransferase